MTLKLTVQSSPFWNYQYITDTINILVYTCIEFLDSNYSIAIYSKFLSLSTVNKFHIASLCKTCQV